MKLDKGAKGTYESLHIPKQTSEKKTKSIIVT